MSKTPNPPAFRCLIRCLRRQNQAFRRFKRRFRHRNTVSKAVQHRFRHLWLGGRGRAERACLSAEVEPVHLAWGAALVCEAASVCG
jgi:hypothetical protein